MPIVSGSPGLNLAIKISGMKQELRSSILCSRCHFTNKTRKVSVQFMPRITMDGVCAELAIERSILPDHRESESLAMESYTNLPTANPDRA